MAITPGLASASAQVVDSAAFETAFDAATQGGKQPYFEVFAVAGDILCQVTPNHVPGANGTKIPFLITSGTSQPFTRFGPGGSGLIEKVELKSAVAGNTAKWTT